MTPECEEKQESAGICHNCYIANTCEKSEVKKMRCCEQYYKTKCIECGKC